MVVPRDLHTVSRTLSLPYFYGVNRHTYIHTCSGYGLYMYLHIYTYPLHIHIHLSTCLGDCEVTKYFLVHIHSHAVFSPVCCMYLSIYTSSSLSILPTFSPWWPSKYTCIYVYEAMPCHAVLFCFVEDIMIPLANNYTHTHIYI